tara:strand:+ start:1035 stop:1172 length:138 start_codon:yes stop_codon:yes gene_type:complete
MANKNNIFDFSQEEIGIENLPVDEEIIQEQLLRVIIREAILAENL